MASFLKLLKTSTGVLDDADYAATQAAPADTVTLSGPRRQGNLDLEISAIELVVEWLDAAEAVVAGLGSFDLQLIVLYTRTAPLTGNVVTGSQTFAGSQGSIGIFVTGIDAGDVCGVRLTNIVGPGGAETHYRVLYREIFGGS